MRRASPESPGPSAMGGRLRHILLLLGLFLLAFGAGLVLFTTGSLSLAWALFPSLAVVAGLFLGIARTWRKASPLWYFPASMLVLLGASLLVLKAAAPSTALGPLWPFLVVFAGISMIPAGMSRRGRMKPSALTLAVSFVLMGCFFLLFSLGIVRMSLRDFFFRLWPVFIIASGAVLLTLSLAGRRQGSPDEEGDGGSGQP